MSSGKPRSGLVSVIVPVFNREAFLREAVGSALGQTYRPIEVILVDDGSTDGTVRLCDELASEHAPLVRVIHQRNSGPGEAREAGRRAAVGEFLQYLDSDDLLHPEKLERQVAALSGRPDCGAAYCRTREYAIGEAPSDRASLQTGEEFEELFPRLLRGRCWQTVTPLFRRSAADRIGPWTSLSQEEDWEYDARAGAAGVRLVWCPEFLADHRHHSGPRAGRVGRRDREGLRSRARAHALILSHARRAGVDADDPNMRRFARELFLLARQTGAAGLSVEARELFDLAREASGPERRGSADFRLYGALARALGWSAAGRLAALADRFRPRGAESGL